MTYYSSVDWWDSRFKIRRPITITPAEVLPGEENLYAVKLTKDSLAGKIKDDYSDLRVVYQIDGDLPTILPYSILDEGDFLSVIFPPIESVQVYESATPSGVYYVNQVDNMAEFLEGWSTESNSTNEYFIYYSGKNKSKQFNKELDLADLDSLTPQAPNILIDYGQEVAESGRNEGNVKTRFTFTKPTVDWVDNSSIEPGATAVFTFTGYSFRLFLHRGTKYGKVEYSINDGEANVIDCYGSNNSETVIVQETQTGTGPVPSELEDGTQELLEDNISLDELEAGVLISLVSLLEDNTEALLEDGITLDDLESSQSGFSQYELGPFIGLVKNLESVDRYKLKIKVLGDKNPASSSNEIKIKNIYYDQVLIGVVESEEYLSKNGKTLVIGS